MTLISIHCYKCYGSGLIRKRNMIGAITYDNCNYCKGLGRRLAKEGSGEHRVAAGIGAIGLGPGIRKHQNDRGWNRR